MAAEIDAVGIAEVMKVDDAGKVRIDDFVAEDFV